MLIRNFAIELATRNKFARCVALHPGTVDTNLSKPFQAGVAADKLFAPDRSAAAVLKALDTATAERTGTLVAWDGQTYLLCGLQDVNRNRSNKSNFQRRGKDCGTSIGPFREGFRIRVLLAAAAISKRINTLDNFSQIGQPSTLGAGRLPKSSLG